INSTVFGNLSSNNGNGAGIEGNGTNPITLINSTVTGNNAGGSGGGVYDFDGELTLTNSIVAGNRTGDHGADLDGGVGSEFTFTGHSIIGSTPSDFNLSGKSNGSINQMNGADANALATVFAQVTTTPIDPGISSMFPAGALANNGGPVATVA